MALALSLPRFQLLPGLAVLRQPWLLPLRDLVSFEALLVLLVFSARYKSHPLIAGHLPADPGLIFLALTLAVAPVLLLRRGVYIPGLLVVGGMVLFTFWMALSWSWSPSIGYAREKLISFVVVCIWPLICTAMLVAGDRERTARLFRLWVYFACWIALEVFLVWSAQGFRGRVYLFEIENYLGYGSVCGPAALIVLTYWATRRSLWSPAALACLAVFAWLMMPLVVGGGRGPLLATFLAMSAVMLIGFDLRDGRVRMHRIQLPIVVTVIAGAAFLTWAIAAQLDTETVNRLERLLSNDIGDSAEERIFQIGETIRLLTEKAIAGWGLGAYGTLVFGQDKRLYPHNLFLELILEFGVIGLALFALAWVPALRRVSVRRIVTDPLFLCGLLVALQAALALQTSWTFAESRNLMLGLGLMMVRPPSADTADPDPAPSPGTRRPRFEP